MIGGVVKLFRRWKQRKEVRGLQLRIDHCRTTIAEVHRSLLSDEVQPEIAEQFHRLESALEQVDASQLGSRDIEKIEMATNKLLDEFRSLYRQGKLKNIYDGPVH
jgi:site-specific recombinase